MTILTKIFLWLSVLGIAAGCAVDFSSMNLSPMLTVFLPLGAVFFGLFLISLMLEKEMAAFDEQEKAKMQLVEAKSAAPVPQRLMTSHRGQGQLKERTI